MNIGSQIVWCSIFGVKIIKKYNWEDVTLMFGSYDDSHNTIFIISKKTRNEILNRKNKQEIIYDLWLVISA